MITVRCQFCERLFLRERPLFLDEQKRSTCPACRREAEVNTLPAPAKFPMSVGAVGSGIHAKAEEAGSRAAIDYCCGKTLPAPAKFPMSVGAVGSSQTVVSATRRMVNNDLIAFYESRGWCWLDIVAFHFCKWEKRWPLNQ